MILKNVFKREKAYFSITNDVITLLFLVFLIYMHKFKMEPSHYKRATDKVRLVPGVTYNM